MILSGTAKKPQLIKQFQQVAGIVTPIFFVIEAQTDLSILNPANSNSQTVMTIANAVANATGVRMRQLPMIPERVWMAMNNEQLTMDNQQ